MYYTLDALDEILSINVPSYVKKDGNYIINEAISFDIEVTSTYYQKDEKPEKVAFMYVWMLDIFDCTIIGRKWEEFVYAMNKISAHFKLSGVKRRLICYVHNLQYEFQFIRKWFKWVKVFSLSRRKPLYALTTTGIEFRCSYRLSGYKLEKVGELVGIKKLTEDFDYTKIRHWKTPLTKKELDYCVHDVKIVSEYIRRKIKEEGDDISSIPLTKTGYVRRYVRNRTLKGANRCFYKAAIAELTLEPEEYLMAKRAFAGGFTHASFLRANHVWNNVDSFDFSSSYPAVLIAEKYPMTKGKKIDFMSTKEFEMRMEREDTCIFTLEIDKVEQIFPCESYISRDRCSTVINPVVNNGRVVSADKVIIDITSVDYNIIKRVYTFELVGVGHFYVYEKYYLPSSFVECILKFYNDKTKLKGIQDKILEYFNGKENLNALFGMCVTDIVRELIEYDNDSGWKPPDDLTNDEYEEFVSNQLDKENNKKSRFLFYLWGVFCTAYARRNLWSGIFECKSDYIYSDTDSVKILHYAKHKAYFERYNQEITEKLEKAMDYHHFPHDLIRPSNIKGEVKPMGIWDFDGHYDKFKAIRAKSYMSKVGDEYHMTVAGLNKENAVRYLKSKGDPLQQFKYGMKIPAQWLNPETGKVESATGKLTHTYIDDEISICVTDYLGNKTFIYEKSSTHLEPAEFHLSKAKFVNDILNGAQPNVYT